MIYKCMIYVSMYGSGPMGRAALRLNQNTKPDPNVGCKSLSTYIFIGLVFAED
ncbi:hypothetical protein Hanom_Chr12g01166281 [Helianthus anomalus]